MKRTLLIFFLVFVSMQFIRTEKDVQKVLPELEIKAPEQIMSVLKTACYDCHSNTITYPWYSEVAPFSWIISSHVKNGKAWLNFSVWENYTEKEKKKKLKEIFRTAYAAMPLQSYIMLHEEADLTREQRTMIRDWTGVKK